MNELLARCELVIDGYAVIGKICWKPIAHENDIFGEGKYLFGYQIGTAMAVKLPVNKVDGHSGVPCVFLRLKRDRVDDGVKVMANDEKEIEVVDEIKIRGIPRQGTELMFNPNIWHEVYLSNNDIAEDSVRMIEQLVANFGFSLVKEV